LIMLSWQSVDLQEIDTIKNMSPGSESTSVLSISIELVHRLVHALCDDGADDVDGIAHRLPH
jgi:hypothetical protein